MLVWPRQYKSGQTIIRDLIRCGRDDTSSDRSLANHASICNITYLEYDATFEDPDGCNINMGLINIHYDPAYNILIQHVAQTYTSPVQLNPAGTTQLSEVIQNSNIETCARLYDDYYIHNDLKVDLKNGIMTVKIGGFTATLHFTILDIPVPRT